MITTILITGTIIAVVLVAYAKVERMSRDFADHHPEFGPYRERHGGCCGACPEDTCSKHND
jgi:hypothetical protein